MGMNKARIFIVEDEIVIVRGLEEALERLDYAVCGFAFAGEEAFEHIAREKPDLVLVDIYLRGAIDGIELAERIKSTLAIPIIFITAYSNREILERAKVTDPFGYIVKPFRERQLKVNIELALERHRTEQARSVLFETYRKTTEELEQEIAERTRELMQTKQDLESAVHEVGLQQQKMEELRWELQQVNQALLALATQMTRTRDELEVEVAAAVRTRILPILNQLEADPHFRKYRTELEMLSMHMGDLSSCLIKNHVSCSALSTMELRVATLIKNGLTSEQMATQLHVSLDTIKTHRRSIRKKLGIQNSRVNLATFLQSRWNAAH